MTMDIANEEIHSQIGSSPGNNPLRHPFTNADVPISARSARSCGSGCLMEGRFMGRRPEDPLVGRAIGQGHAGRGCGVQGRKRCELISRGKAIARGAIAPMDVEDDTREVTGEEDQNAIITINI